MDTTNQSLDRTAVTVFVLAIVTLAITWMLNVPAATAKHAAVTEALDAVVEAPAAEGRYKVVVTGLRLPQRNAPSATAAVSTGQPRT
ncbi:hypothetical protein [Usitatibacter palustris]|uniref:Uncharacterized protein n=1 Tax=Usitatibacter palustris TaxID=2732487 RepID=A0A6M4HDH6_9PROT|nr:hypothetical protein [Usitatibacter palustris]QJR16788.1 hypothetical protein DSM104440_03624 [Usitatibacter palustris]